MKVKYSKDFVKSIRKLSGKMLLSARNAIQEIIDAESIEDISDCKKLTSYKYIYRIRIGSYRAFFVFHVQITDDTVKFEYLLSRGEAYNKKNMENLRNKDK